MISRDNRLIKLALKLKQKKYREEENRYLIEGIRFIEEGIKAGTVEHIFYSSKLLDTRGSERIIGKHESIHEVEPSILKELCDTENPQGVVAIAVKSDCTLDSISGDFLVITDGIQDPGNMGTIVRTCHAAGASALIVLKGCVDIYNSKTLRSTMGSIFNIPIIFMDSFEELSNILKQKEFKIYAASLDTESYIYDCNFKDKTAIVIGNEANGIPEAHMAFCTDKIKIPITETSESLNAAIAGAVIIFEIVRQRFSNSWQGH